MYEPSWLIAGTISGLAQVVAEFLFFKTALSLNIQRSQASTVIMYMLLPMTGTIMSGLEQKERARCGSMILRQHFLMKILVFVQTGFVLFYWIKEVMSGLVQKEADWAFIHHHLEKTPFFDSP